MACMTPPVITGIAGGFVDNLLNVFLKILANCQHQPHVVPLAVFVTSRPHAGEAAEPMLQRAVISMEKLVKEGTPKEI
jgi:hypothetical protein